MTIPRHDPREAARHPFCRNEFGNAFEATDEVVDVPAWNTVLMARRIPGSDRRDVAGFYPFTPLVAPVDLGSGLAQLADSGFVSVVLVTDPLWSPPVEELAPAFDIVKPFKTHYAYDPSCGPINYTRRHWREVRIARENLEIAEVDFLSTWKTFARLYDNLVESHHISGTAAFSSGFFERLATVGGLRAVAARYGGEIVSMMLFVEFRKRIYSFLAGTTDIGRKNSAHYGLYAEALENLGGYDIVNLGGAPGLSDDPEHGIAFAKRRLTNSTLKSHLCCAVLDARAYTTLASGSGVGDFFPAYRRPPSG